MSVESTCDLCGLVDKNVCRSPEEAEDCRHAPAEYKGPVIRTGPLAGLRRRHYNAIYADPPWTFTTRSDKGKDRSPEQHYDCMTLDEIKALPVAELATKDCVLFMWIIDTHAEMAFEVLKAWGFTYKTKGFTWAKTNADGTFFTGMGFWTRANPEDCLLATRGHPKRMAADVRRLIVAPRREHSRKPDAAYDGIERLVAGPYCELFSRSSRPGWDQMGNEKGKFDTLSREELDDIAGLV
jgi:N6-adenosine-specific RNA methylase IME4